MVRVLEGRADDERLVAQPAGDRVDRGDLERLLQRQRRQDARQPLRQHRLPGARRPEQEQMVPTGGGDLHRCPPHRLTTDVQEVEQALFGGGAGEESVRGGVILPEGTQIAGLPAFDGLRRLFVAGVRGELVLLGPAADAGAVGFEVEAAQQFAGAGAVGGGGLAVSRVVSRVTASGVQSGR